MGQANVGVEDEVPVNVGSSVDDCANCDPEFIPISANPKPKWRAVLHIDLDEGRLPVLSDSGCTGSCVSFEYFQGHPQLKKSFVPMKSQGTAINGSEVPSVGQVQLQFSVAGVPMTAT